MTHQGRATLLLAPLLIAAACALPSASNGREICDTAAGSAPSRSQRTDGRTQDVDFLRADILPSRSAIEAGGGRLEVISLNQDILRTSDDAARGSVSSRTADLRVLSIVCVRHRPEMLGLVLWNAGRESLGGIIQVEVSRAGGTDVLFGRLPRMEPGEERRILLAASDPLAGARTVSIEVREGRDRGRPGR